MLEFFPYLLIMGCPLPRKEKNRFIKILFRTSAVDLSDIGEGEVPTLQEKESMSG
jgi:hypothetical protein